MCKKKIRKKGAEKKSPTGLEHSKKIKHQKAGFNLPLNTNFSEN